MRIENFTKMLRHKATQLHIGNNILSEPKRNRKRRAIKYLKDYRRASLNIVVIYKSNGKRSLSSPC
jgi:hypothetical protein